ncbi:SsgA family sporulation/cell division regulator [Streptomyces sp. CA-106110]|uniref:SsgA family sporulation/cell division regulator n=1 Tax=Streptomyces sp. CA-106110 TaxID=3240044 RepID=UPI003D9314CE
MSGCGQPAAQSAECRVLLIALRPPMGSALLEVPAHEVEVFLRNAYSEVSPGSESKQLDLDTELALVLSDR